MITENWQRQFSFVNCIQIFKFILVLPEPYINILVLLSYLIGVSFYLFLLSPVVIFFFFSILFQSPVLQSRILASPSKSKVDLFNGTYHHSNIWRSPKRHLMRLCTRLEIKQYGITTTAVLQLIIRSSGPLCTGRTRA